ncbi:MAG: VCBS repeat-containing protein [Bacteroidota bacterium]
MVEDHMPYSAPPLNSLSNHAWVDLDNDGDLDLVYNSDVTGGVDVKIYKNGGGGELAPYTDSELTTAANGGTRDIEFADFDNDGLVDALKLNRQQGTAQHSTLYRNTGGGNLKLVIGSAFETVRATHRTASWGDYDNDGDLDVFLGSQTISTPDNINRLFKNNGDGTFSEVVGSAMTEQVLTYGSAWADIDNDYGPRPVDLHECV